MKAPTAAFTTWDNLFPPTNIKIRVDANNGTHIQFVLHELLHIIFYTMFIGFVDETLEEVIILAFDQYMYNYINKVPARLSKWNTLIDEKLSNKAETYSLEERAAR